MPVSARAELCSQPHFGTASVHGEEQHQTAQVRVKARHWSGLVVERDPPEWSRRRH
jgi:hypothetical protein